MIPFQALRRQSQFKQMTISLIVAMSKNRVIGKDGKLPWKLPKELRYFKETTEGHPVIMGRKTYESIGRPLPGRKNIILTRQKNLSLAGCSVVDSFDSALQHVGENEEVFVIGGGEIYKVALPRADKIHLTVVDAVIEGDAFFPDFDDGDWNLVSKNYHRADDNNPYNFSINVYEKKASITL
jgi:dihydrofolate reductase